MRVEQRAGLRLKVLAESNAGALRRVLQFFQARNVVPERVLAERVGSLYQEFLIEVNGRELDADAFARIVAKIGQLPEVMAAVSCDRATALPIAASAKW